MSPWDAEPKQGPQKAHGRSNKLEWARGGLGWMNSREGSQSHAAGFYEPHVLAGRNVWQLELNWCKTKPFSYSPASLCDIAYPLRNRVP